MPIFDEYISDCILKRGSEEKSKTFYEWDYKWYYIIIII